MLQAVKDTIISYTGNISTAPTGHSFNMLTRSPSRVERYGRPTAQNSTNRSDRVSSTAHSTYALETDLRKCKDELHKARLRCRSLRYTKNKLHADVKDLRSQITSLDADLSDLQSLNGREITECCIRQYARTNGLRVRGNTIRSYDDMLNRMLKDALQVNQLRTEIWTLEEKAQAAQKEKQNLQRQLSELRDSLIQTQGMQDQFQKLQNEVQTLQKELLTHVGKVNIISDDVLAKDFRNLAAIVKSLNRSVQITKDLNVVAALGSRRLLLNVNEHPWGARARKKSFIEAWIWSVLLEMVFESPFTILGGLGATISQLWSILFGSGHHREHAIRTMGLTANSNTDFGEAQEHSDDIVPQFCESEELQTRKFVAYEIDTNLAKLSTATDFSLVSKITEAAFALGLQMSLQQSRLQITFPDMNDQFDPAQMVPTPDPDGKDLEGGVVAFVVRPGLTERGDAHGKHFDQRYDIVPSSVQLQPQRMNVVIKPEPI